MVVNVDELRRRLDVPAEFVDDTLLLACLSVAQEQLSPWFVSDAAILFPSSVDEATYQLAVKVWDTSTKGTVGMDAIGDFTLPSPSATAGMIRSVFGVMGPALRQGGLSV